MTDKSVKPSALALLPFLENMNLMSKSFFALACATLTFVTIGAPVEWTFPLTGVLVWGGGDTINLTVGRADLWDHRGGYPWTDEQSYTNIVAAVESGDTKRLLGLFRKETPKGEPCNPYMLPLGRVVVKLQGGATLARGELDPFTGSGKLILSDGKAIELAMSKKSRAFAMRAVGGDVPYGVSVRHCMEFPSAKEALEAVGFEKAKPWADEDVEGPAGFVWKLPAGAWRRDLVERADQACRFICANSRRVRRPLDEILGDGRAHQGSGTCSAAHLRLRDVPLRRDDRSGRRSGGSPGSVARG